MLILGVAARQAWLRGPVDRGHQHPPQTRVNMTTPTLTISRLPRCVPVAFRPYPYYTREAGSGDEQEYPKRQDTQEEEKVSTPQRIPHVEGIIPRMAFKEFSPPPMPSSQCSCRSESSGSRIQESARHTAMQQPGYVGGRRSHLPNGPTLLAVFATADKT
ncbi:hypothetical protein GCM10023334_106500 [Nonomuraea thailandensis]